MKENSKMNQIMASQMLKEAMAIRSTSKENVIDILEYIIKKVKEIDEKDYLAQTINDIDDNDYATLGIAGTAMIDIGQLLATVAIKKLVGTNNE